MSSDPKFNYSGINESKIKAWATISPGYAALQASNLTVSIGFATAAVNAAVLLNGAAATAMLALIGTLLGNSNFKDLLNIVPGAALCLKFFATGALFAVVSAGLGYAAHCSYSDSISSMMNVEKYNFLEINSEEIPSERNASLEDVNRGHSYRFLAICAFFISLISFFIGSVNGLDLLLQVRLHN